MYYAPELKQWGVFNPSEDGVLWNCFVERVVLIASDVRESVCMQCGVYAPLLVRLMIDQATATIQMINKIKFFLCNDNCQSGIHNSFGCNWL